MAILIFHNPLDLKSRLAQSLGCVIYPLTSQQKCCPESPRMHRFAWWQLPNQRTGEGIVSVVRPIRLDPRYQ